MQYLQKHSLYISNPKNSLYFYVYTLGMKLIKEYEENEVQFYHLKFNEDTNEAILELIFDKNNTKTIYPKENERLTGYWKIAISIKDVDIAREKLIKKGVSITPAFQVPNVAYLCHFNDPDGYTLELIQHNFENNHIKEPEDKNYVLGNKAIFSLITYRVRDIQKSLEFYEKELKMKLLSKMNVLQRGFELYFLGYTKDNLPNKNIEAIENRQWLWQRDFTMIELQYILESQKENFSYETGISSGFESITINSSKKKTLFDCDNYKIKLEENTIKS